MAGFYDFDAARAARKASGPVLRAFGEDVVLPPAMPAAYYLLRARAILAQDLTVPMMVEQLVPFVGHRIDVWLDENPDLDLDDLADLMRNCVRLIAQETPPQGEAEAPAEGASASPPPTSSSSGDSSTPTSPASTASTSPPPSSTTASTGPGSSP